LINREKCEANEEIEMEPRGLGEVKMVKRYIMVGIVTTIVAAFFNASLLIRPPRTIGP
jgi:hypothetical protein